MCDAKIVNVLVAEEDYKYSLFDDLTPEQLDEVKRDANSHEESFVWRELWLHDEGEPQVMNWEVHGILNRSWMVEDE